MARNGVYNLMICEPKRGFRQLDISDRRIKIDFAQRMKQVVDLYPEASVLHVAMDNLNTHKAASLYEASGIED